ncbi:MAG: hypothetical protein HHJ09_14200 [Glaciimonas sp.]|nr:hypothetical protein [Glaciimonas sp.]
MLKRLLKGKFRFYIAVAIVGVVVLAACAPFVKLALPFSGFADVHKQPKVHYEQGAEQLADEIATLYPDAISKIEKTHGSQFGKQPEVYICVSEECYKKYAFVPIARGETRSSGGIIMLNGFKLSRDGTAGAIFTHELSHAYWFTRGVHCQPRWWEEGLAVYVSGGGGAEKATLSAATQAIRENHVFHPSSESSCSFVNSAAKYDLDWPMYYRQSGMFVEFLHTSNPSAFNLTLTLLRNKTELPEAIQKAYDQPVEALRKLWLSSITKA